MTEQKVQRRIIKEYETQGYYALKLAKTNKNGIPDLLFLKKGKAPVFIEVKKIGGVTSELQLFRIRELKDNGFEAYVIEG